MAPADMITAMFLIAGLAGIASNSVIIFFSSRRRHTRCLSDWSSDVCSSDISVLLFEVLGRLYGKNTKMVSGEYFFPGPEDIFTIVSRLVHGDRELVPVRVRVPEGATSQQISDLLAQKVADFEAETFLAQAKPEE